MCYLLTETRTQIHTTFHMKIVSIFSELASPWFDAGDDEDSRRRRLIDGEADEMIREGRGTRARNLDLLELQGTHYTEESRLDDAEGDVIYA